MIRFFIALVIACIFFVAGAGLYAYGWFSTSVTIDTVNENKQLIFEIKRGQNLTQVANELASLKLITLPRLLALYGRFTKNTNIKPGEYYIVENDTPESLLKKFIAGNIINYSVTLIEGRTFKEALQQIQSKQKISVELTTEAEIDEFVKQLNIENKHPEGWFFPDTYTFNAGTSDKKILEQAHQRMLDVLATEWSGRAEGLPYKKPYDALIMASIVERETGQASEREQIAGVFVRRLQKNIRLQTDPTIIYGLGDAYTGNIQRKHLSQKTPYNTYVINGLPPTPIALPGREAIYAALHPDDGDTLYFVAKGDGSHQFSETLEEHNKAVVEYQIRKRKKNYQSAPTQSGSAQTTPLQ